MGRLSDVNNALTAKLSSLDGLPQVAYENMLFQPTKGTQFLRPTLLPVSADFAGLNYLQKNSGIYVIEMFFPKQNGSGNMLTLADSIYDHFRADTFLTAGTTKVYIKQIERTPIRIDESWAVSTIDIHFDYYTI